MGPHSTLQTQIEQRRRASGQGGHAAHAAWPRADELEDRLSRLVRAGRSVNGPEAQGRQPLYASCAIRRRNSGAARRSGDRREGAGVVHRPFRGISPDSGNRHDIFRVEQTFCGAVFYTERGVPSRSFAHDRRIR